MEIVIYKMIVMQFYIVIVTLALIRIKHKIKLNSRFSNWYWELGNARNFSSTDSIWPLNSITRLIYCHCLLWHWPFVAKMSRICSRYQSMRGLTVNHNIIGQQLAIDDYSERFKSILSLIRFRANSTLTVSSSDQLPLWYDWLIVTILWVWTTQKTTEHFSYFSNWHKLGMKLSTM